MSNLPDKLSELILVATTDLLAIKDNSLFRVDMDVWFNLPGEKLAYEQDRDPETHKPVCTVCMAGAVMAQRLDVKKHWHPDGFTLAPEMFKDDCNKLHALDQIRRGEVMSALHLMCKSEEDHNRVHHAFLDHFWDEYPERMQAGAEANFETDPEAFIETMQTIAGVLHAEGF